MDYRHGCFAERADKNLQQLWINGHAGMVAQGRRDAREVMTKAEGFSKLKQHST
jgi:hypothetical protein